MTDAAKCRRLLQLRDTQYSLALVFRLGRWRYLVQAVVLTLSIWLAASPRGGARWIGLLLTGFLVGVLLRDLGLMLRIKRSWPLTVRITNWETVERLAEGGGG